MQLAPSEWKQGAASVMVWAAVTETGRSPLVFVDDGVKLNQENYCTSILECIVALGAKEFQKQVLVVPARLHLLMERKRHRIC